MPQLYRIVDEFGNGMYNGYDYAAGREALVTRAGIRNDLCDEIRHPSPDEDGGLCEFWQQLTYEQQRVHVFGFDSIAQLRNWMYKPDWIVTLHRWGGKVLVIEYDESDVAEGFVTIGWTQAVFFKQLMRSDRVTEISLLDLL